MSDLQPEVTTLIGRLAHRLVKNGFLSPEQAQEAFEQFLKTHQSFVTYLVEKKLVSGYNLAMAVAEEFSMYLVDIDAINLNPETVKRIDEKLLKKHKVLPIFERGNCLFIAISDPTNLSALDEIKLHTKMDIEAVVVEEDKLAKVIERLLEAFERMREVFDISLKNLGTEHALEFFDMTIKGLEGEVQVINNLKLCEEDKSDAAEADVEDDAPVVKFINKMILDAIKMGASALHFEPYEKFYRVRFRVDGILIVIATPPVILSRKLAARLKRMAHLDASERRVPQDGRIKLKVSATKEIDFRVSTMPTRFGEKVVLRIFDSSALPSGFNMDVLGYEPEQKQLYLEALSNPYGGMILFTGPAGCGKTVSLYAGINILNQEGVAISTVEDPIETNFPGVNQVQVDEKTGMTFTSVLRKFRDQDPDVILVGEIRNYETVGLPIQAALKGRLVMSVLYINDAPQALTRLVDMGIAPFAIADAVKLIIAQSLCLRLCTCKIEHDDIPDEFLLREGFKTEDLERRAKGEWKLYTNKPNGCEHCNRQGFKGRIGIYQVMPISKAIKRLIMDGGNATAIADQAALEGIADLRKSGLKKVMDGIISLSEVDRVAGLSQY